MFNQALLLFFSSKLSSKNSVYRSVCNAFAGDRTTASGFDGSIVLSLINQKSKIFTGKMRSSQFIESSTKLRLGVRMYNVHEFTKNYYI
jgi:hypothetical protein